MISDNTIPHYSPWMSDSEIEMILKYLDKNDTMLEWGSGGSTLLFSMKVKKYHSIEHDASWYNNISKAIYSKKNDNVFYHLVGTDEPLSQPTQKSQIQTYIDYVDVLNESKFDKVLIDGRGRGWCAEKILKYLHEDSIVFIHDYWQRPQYRIVEKWYDVVDKITDGQSLVVLKPKLKFINKIRNMNISIIQPSRNNLKYLKWSYEAIRKNQGEHEVEICVADDFSNDGTWEWCLEIMDKDPNFKAIRNEGPTRLGHTILYDKLINEVASHDICMIYHADMYLCPGALDSISKYIKPKIIVSLTRIEPPLHPDGPEKILADFGVETEEFDEEKFINWFENDFKPKYYQPTEGIFAPWAFYKSDFQEIGGHDKLFAPQSKEDSDIFNRFQLNGVEFLQTWEGYVYHMTCRGSRFNPTLTTPGVNSDEWTKQNIRSSRNFIRKWGHFVKHDILMKPIIPHKYDVSFVIHNANIQHVEILEPWCSKMYVSSDINHIVEKYIELEQPNTSFDLRERISTENIDFDKHNIILEFDGAKFNQNSYNIIQNLSEIIDESGEIGIFELDCFKVTINNLNTYEKDLIKIKN